MDQNPDTDDLIPEVCSMFGVFLLFWSFEDRFRDNLCEMGMTKQEKHILVQLGSPLRMGILAKRMMQLPSSITASADSLEQKGLLARSRDPNDRRAWLLELTPKGQQIRTDLFDEVRTAFHEISGLDIAETKQLAGLMDKVRKRIQETGLPAGVEL
ncbi:MAG: MarR family winged helix-turn-helix transcriptional regulator [Paracoccaceae bacterium]|jgi:DNA-binding MarR family transcriptional regulator